MARILGRSVGKIQEDRFEAARYLARESQTVVLLKGAYTVIAEPEGRVFVNGKAQEEFAGIQFDYRVVTDGARLNPKTLENLGIYRDDMVAVLPWLRDVRARDRDFVQHRIDLVQRPEGDDLMVALLLAVAREAL